MNDMEDDESIQSAREESVPTKSLGSSGAGIGRTINHYKLLSTLGEGGMGIVYLAQQQHPIKRRVALKVIKPGMDTKQVLARFEAERQALAMLDHPNIAHVFEAGATEAGHPYFVMEYVEGVPITEHCDRHRLNIEDRLNLFRQACEAIQHAHQKGIIHRDIKPSNILVTIEQDKETLKIIDFGVAKATSQTLTERTLFTEQGLLIGTPEYMSPEQAEMTAQGIDTRSDIYSLGVVLYELLTGALPFDPAILRQAAFAEIQRIIREQDPPRPSTRLSSLGADATKVASSRRTEVASLTKRLHKELEWIPLKAMRKERDQRYKTASELGEDIKNYLDGSPLIAGPESAAYRVKKFIRKRRGPVVAAAVIVTTILVGLVASTTLYFQAEQARTQAVNARDKAQEAQKAEALQRAEAEKLKKEAVNRLVDHYEEQGRLYMESGKLDEALVFLNEAYQLDDQRYSLRFLLAETQRRLKSPIFLENEGPLAWEEIAKEGKLEHFTFNAAGDRVAAQRDYSAMLFGLWDAKTGKFIEEFDLSFGGFSADGTRFLALPSSFGEFRKSHHLQLCASSDGHLIAPLPGSFGYFAVDGKHVITVAGDGHFRIFDSTNGQLEIILKANLNIDLQQKGGSMERSEGLTRQIHVFGRLRRISFATSELAQMSSDGLRMVTIGDPNGSATVWEIKNGKRLYSIQPKTGAFTYATFSPNGQRLLTTRFAMKDEPVPLFVSTNLESESQLNIGKEDLRDPAATKESDRRSFKFDEGIAEVWSLDEGKRLTKLDDTAFFHYYERTIYSHFSPDGTTAITGERSQLKVWDLQKPVLLWQTKASLGTYSPDGKRIITGESNGLITVRDTRTGEKVGAIVGHQHTLESVRFCSDGSDCRIVTEDASRKCIISSWPQLQSWRGFASLSRNQKG